MAISHEKGHILRCGQHHRNNFMQWPYHKKRGISWDVASITGITLCSGHITRKGAYLEMWPASQEYLYAWAISHEKGHILRCGQRHRNNFIKWPYHMKRGIYWDVASITGRKCSQCMSNWHILRCCQHRRNIVPSAADNNVPHENWHILICG